MLLIDDNPHDLALIRSAFQRVGSQAEIDVVPDVGVAIGMIEKGLRPVLVIVDLRLNGESGLDFVDWLRSESAATWIPVVVLSGSDDRSDVRASYDAGANAYLVKPQTLDETDELVRRIDAFWLGACALADDPPV